MTTSAIAQGVVHTVPTDLCKILMEKPKVHAVWQDLTPLARNEWLCWVESAKKLETRNRRIRILCENLTAGKRRPCCWAGCVHQ